MFLAVRLSVLVIDPIPLVFLRYSTAIFSLFIAAKLMKIDLSPVWIDRKDWKLIFLTGLIGQTLSIVTQETGTMLTSAQTGSVVTASTPAFMVIFGYLILHEKLTVGRILSVILATIGVLFVVFDPDNFQISISGGIFLFIAAITWAVLSVLLKLLKKYSVVVVTFYCVLVALILLAPYSIWWLSNVADWNAIKNPEVFLSVIYLGVISTTLGFCAWNKGLLYMDAAVAGIFMFFQPIVGTILGYFVLNEPITIYFWIGFVLIILGVLLSMKKT